jgi:AraC-like DNA-binding protein
LPSRDHAVPAAGRARSGALKLDPRPTQRADHADGSGLPPFRLCRLFRLRAGMTITRYRHSLRLHLALDRLRHRRLDLTALALDLGFSSHSHFTFVFRRHFGITPSQFRASTGGRSSTAPAIFSARCDERF